MLNEDYRDMLQCLLEEKVRFLLVGAYAVSGVDFEAAYANKEDVSIEGLQVPVISLEDLIENKRASGRAQDLADVEKLEALKQK